MAKLDLIIDDDNHADDHVDDDKSDDEYVDDDDDDGDDDVEKVWDNSRAGRRAGAACEGGVSGHRRQLVSTHGCIYR